MTTVVVQPVVHEVIVQNPRPSVVVAPQHTQVVSEPRVTRVVNVSNPRVAVTTEQVTRTIELGIPGPAGPQGVPGPTGAGVLAPIDFAFGDASPAIVLTLSEDTEFVLVSLQIEEVFNGAGAAIQLGVVGQPGLLMDAWQNDPGAAEVFETSPRVELALGTQLLLTINPGAGASTGRGQFILTSVPLT